MYEHSKQIAFFCPRIVDLNLATKPGKMLVALTIGYFEDDQLWVQMREYNKVMSDSVIPNQGKPWLPIPLQGIKSTPRGRSGVLQIPLNQLTYPMLKEDEWEIYPVLSLAPHECGIINKNWFPRNDHDMERLIKLRA